MHAFDRQTDRQTDGQTDGQTDRNLIVKTALHSMQRGKKVVRLGVGDMVRTEKEEGKFLPFGGSLRYAPALPKPQTSLQIFCVFLQSRTGGVLGAASSASVMGARPGRGANSGMPKS